VCSSDLPSPEAPPETVRCYNKLPPSPPPPSASGHPRRRAMQWKGPHTVPGFCKGIRTPPCVPAYKNLSALSGNRAGAAAGEAHRQDRKSTRLNSSHVSISYAVFCLKKKKKNST